MQLSATYLAYGLICGILAYGVVHGTLMVSDILDIFMHWLFWYEWVDTRVDAMLKIGKIRTERI